jgi:hypothetical protein
LRRRKTVIPLLGFSFSTSTKAGRFCYLYISPQEHYIMAKDPAVLFYTSDFLTGTMTMTNEQVGKYIRLLCLQHQKNFLTEEDMTNICNSYDKHIYSKFTHADGVYFNERMREEKLKRINYSQSRSGNRSGKTKEKIISSTYVPHMEIEIEITILYNKYSLDLKWLADCGKTLSVSDHRTLKLLADFNLHLRSNKIEKKKDSEYISHFLNWARKQSGVNRPSGTGHFNGLMGN